MSGGHAHLSLYIEREGFLHRLAPECKVASTFLFVLAVVATPPVAYWAFGIYAAMLTVIAITASLPLHHLFRRMTIEIPFVAFALFLPFIGGGPRVELLGIVVSHEGALAAWNIFAKATLGVGAAVLLTAATLVPDILLGLERLKVPRTITSVAGFMVRYADVVVDEMRRMRIARESRGYSPRWIWHARAVAASGGALFIRSYERGERVWTAMASRGFDGSMPRFEPSRPAAQWPVALVLPGTAGVVAVCAWLTIL